MNDMINCKYLSWLSIVLLFQVNALAQNDYDMLRIEGAGTYNFTRKIDESVWHYNVLGDIVDGYFGSEVLQIRNNTIEQVFTIDDLNDSLACHHLMDIWKVGDSSIHFMAFSNHKNKPQDYISIGSFDESMVISVMDNIPIGNFYYLQLFGSKEHFKGGNRVWYLPVMDSNDRTNEILMISANDLTYDYQRFFDNEELSLGTIRDIFVDNVSDQTILFSVDFLVVDHDTDTIADYEYRVIHEGIPGNVLEAMIIGKKKEAYHVIERQWSRDNQNVLISRQISFEGDSLSVEESYTELTPDEDVYLARKILKDSFNYVNYSRSSINGFDNNYGFNVMVFNKEGELLHNNVFESNRPLAMGDMDIDESRMTVYGCGTFLDNGEQFSVSASISKEPVSNTEQVEWQTEGILQSTLVNEAIKIREEYLTEDILVYDMQGRLWLQSSDQLSIDARSLPTGVYVITALISGEYQSERFYKR